jgi:hypothetical protein
MVVGIYPNFQLLDYCWTLDEQQHGSKERRGEL